MKQVSIATLQRQRDALLKQLASIGPLIEGSLCTRKVKCGKPGCRCADGQPHQASALTRKLRGHTVTTHVPRDLCDEVRQWTEQYRRLKALIKQISSLSEQIIRRHVPTSRAVARNRARQAPTPP